MLCLVRQPNAVILEVEVPSKAKGKQCLEKVCSMLGVIESDYVGLQYVGPHGDNLWVNLRNQLRHQLVGLPPYRLNLRIKFYVPPHLILQDTTRHLFYLDLSQEFVKGRLRAPQAQVIHLAALIAQAEFGDLEPSNRALALLHYHKWLPENYCTSGEGSRSIRVRWCSGESTSAQPESEGTSSDDTELYKQSQNADKESNSLAETIFCEAVLKEHTKLCGVKPKTAEYLFLENASTLEDFGAEHFSAKNACDDGQIYRISVGPIGISIQEEDLVLKFSISYTCIQLASHTGRCFFLDYIDDHGDNQSSCFKLESCHRASALYRTLTEKHAFYSCETVRNTVTSQFIRDLKGTIASIFNENTALGKNYVFDIQRTFREVYDHTRRLIYQAEAQLDSKPISEMTHLDSEMVMAVSDRKDCNSPSCKAIKDQLISFHDSLLCRVCMDTPISTVFFPCRHVICCNSCASICTNCPLCRTDVQDAQQIYLPFLDLQQIAQNTHL